MAHLKLAPICACALAVAVAWTDVRAQQVVTVYTSMKESMIGELSKAFARRHPEIAMEYLSASTGKLMARIAAERRSGVPVADILWMSEIGGFYQLKAAGALHPYVPAEIRALIQPLPDYDGSFTAARLGTMGIAYNTRLIARPPTRWDDLGKPAFSGGLGIADPQLSGTAAMSVSILSKHFGWTFFEDLRANGAKTGRNSAQVVDDTASGDLVASLAVDYIALDKVDNGAPIGFVHPPEMIVIPSPVAILKGTPDLAAAKAFIDFLLSREGQTTIANEGTLPVRTDVTVPERFHLPPVAEAQRRAMQIDYADIADDADTLRRFGRIMQR